MKLFEYKGDTLAIIDGDIWLKLQVGTAPVPNLDAPARKRGRRKGWKSGMPPRATRKGRARLEPEDIDKMKEMINADYPAQDIATKYDVSASYVYNIKLRMKKDGELTLTEQP